MKKISKITAIILCVALVIGLTCPAAGPYANTEFIQDRNEKANATNIRTLLQLKDTQRSKRISKFLDILTVSEALEKFYHGEFSDGAADLGKLFITSVSGIAKVVAAAADVAAVCREGLIKAVIEPVVQKYYKQYRDLRLKDLQGKLDKKKLGFNGDDFVNWATDADGLVGGKTKVNDFITLNIVSEKRDKGLYNVAATRIMDKRHSGRAWYIKMIGRMGPVGKTVTPIEARDHWLKEWNKKVVVDGMEHIVRKKKQYIETYTKSTTIDFRIELKNPVKGIEYGMRCKEFGWNLKHKAEEDTGKWQGFLRTVTFEKFMEVSRKAGKGGAAKFELLLPDGKVVQSKDVKFADMMSTAGSTKYEDETGIYREHVTRISFDWEPPSVGSVGISVPSGAKIESLSVRMGKASVNLSTRGNATGMPGKSSGTFSIEQWVSGTAFEIMSLLEKMEFDPGDYLFPQHRTAYPALAVNGSYKIKVQEGDREVEQTERFYINVELPEEDNSFAVPRCPRANYNRKTAEEIKAIYEGMVRDFVANPGTYPGDLMKFRAKLPSWPRDTKVNLLKDADQKLTAGVVGSYQALNSQADELRKKYNTRITSYWASGAFWSEKERILYEMQRTADSMCSAPPVPIYRDSIVAKIEELMAETKATREEIEGDRELADELLATAKRDIVPEIPAVMNLLAESSYRTLSSDLSKTMADLVSMLTDQDFELDELARIETDRLAALASFDARLASVQDKAGAGAFYGKRVEELQAESEALGLETEEIASVAIRELDNRNLLYDLLGNFNAWVTGNRYSSGYLSRQADLARRAASLPLDALYEHVMGSGPLAKDEPWPEIDKMVETLMKEFYRLTSEEVALLDRYADANESMDSILKNAFKSSGKDGLSPIGALHASHLSMSDLEPALSKGVLIHTALNPARQRANKTRQSWNAFLQELRNGRRSLDDHSLAGGVGPRIGEFLDVCDMTNTAGGNAVITEWNETGDRIEANMAQLATVGLAGLGDEVLKACADIDKLGELKYSPELAKAPWRARYAIQREQSGIARTIGDQYLDAIVEAAVRLLGVVDTDFHTRLARAEQLTGAARAKELAKLREWTSQDGLGAVGVLNLRSTQYGTGLAILWSSRNPGPFEAVHSKWSEVVGGWMKALDQH